MAYQRDSSKDISLGTGDWNASVSDGTTIWFVNNTGSSSVARAYNVATRARDSAKDITFATNNRTVAAAAYDGTLVWLVDTSGQAKAYNSSGREQRFGATVPYGLRNDVPDFSKIDIQSAFSDGTTIWFSDRGNRGTYAYTLATTNGTTGTAGTRDSSKDFSLRIGLHGGAYDGTTLWVVLSSSTDSFAFTAATRAPQHVHRVRHRFGKLAVRRTGGRDAVVSGRQVQRGQSVLPSFRAGEHPHPSQIPLRRFDSHGQSNRHVRTRYWAVCP